jgi:hypothetical protein
MTTPRLGLEHHTGSLATLGEGQWARDDATRCAPMVFHRCSSCGGTYSIDVVKVSIHGDVVDEFICQTPSCTEVAWLRLESWQAFDVSDVTP